jgi:hypothetical protein
MAVLRIDPVAGDWASIFAHAASSSPRSALMAMLTGYFDAAGHPAGDGALTVGGFVAPVRNWRKLGKHWRRACDEEGIAVFHMTDFMASQQAFVDWRDQPRRKAVFLRKLTKLVRDYAHFWSVSTIVLDDWRTLNDEFALDECHASPYCLAAFSVIHKSIRWIGKEHPRDMLCEFVFEEGDCDRGDLLHFMDWVRKLIGKDWEKCCNIYPVFKPKTLEPLQAADFAAWEQRTIATEFIEGEFVGFRPAMQQFLRLENDNGIIDKPKLIEYCDSLGVPKREAWRLMSQRERARWRPVSYQEGKLFRASQRSDPGTISR